MSRPIVVGVALRADDAAPLALARTLARLTGAPLALVTGFPHESVGLIEPPDYALVMRQDVQRRLEFVADSLRGEHEVTFTVCQGGPAHVLHDVAAHREAAAVVVGSTHHGPLGRLLMGDVAAGLLHGAQCPVAVAPRGYVPAARTFGRIAVAFTNDQEGRRALAAAAAIAGRCGVPLHSFTVVEPINWAAASAGGWMPPADVENATREHARQAAAAALAALPDGLEATAEVLAGEPVHALAAGSEQFDLIVCGSRGYGALRSVVAGGVARGLAHTAACPLLVVPRATAVNHPLVAGTENAEVMS